MSRIGRMPIPIPSGVTVTLKDNTITDCGIAVQVDANAQLEIGNNTLSNNRINGIVVKGDSLPATEERHPR